MNFKRHWSGENGATSIYAKESSGCQKLEIDMLHLEPGAKQSFQDKDKEFAIVLLGGTCHVTGEGMQFSSIGTRKDVWSGKATAVYVPRNLPFCVEAVTECTACVAKCPSTEDFAPALVTPEDIVIKQLGKPGFLREAHFILDERVQASRIYLGENFIQGGQWSSFPGHKHDTEAMPAEGFAEEIYYYEFDKETGYGIQQVYTDDKSVDEVYPVRNHDFVELPVGYHPCTVAPGYRGYLLWIMSCDHRGFYMTIDPDHAWLVK